MGDSGQGGISFSTEIGLGGESKSKDSCYESKNAHSRLRFNFYFYSQRGISLLSEIPETRTCAQADIEPHWCACLSWTKMDVGDEKVKKAATAVLTTINSLTESQREKCETLTLMEVRFADR